MILILSNSMKHLAIIASPNSIMFWNVNLLSNYYIENNRPWKRWTTSHAAIGSNIRLFYVSSTEEFHDVFEATSGLKWTNPNGLKCSSSYKKDIARIMIKLLDHLQVIYKSNHIIIILSFFLCLMSVIIHIIRGMCILSTEPSSSPGLWQVETNVRRNMIRVMHAQSLLLPSSPWVQYSIECHKARWYWKRMDGAWQPNHQYGKLRGFQSVLASARGLHCVDSIDKQIDHHNLT